MQLVNVATCGPQERMAQTWKASHRYLVEPASATARVRRERSGQPLRARTRPRLTAHLTLHTVALNLTSVSVRFLVSLYGSIST